MLWLVTVNNGKILVFNAACSPNQNPATNNGIKAMVTAVLKYSFRHSLLSSAAKFCLPLTQHRCGSYYKNYRFGEIKKEN